MELSPVMYCSDRGLKHSSGQQPGPAAWSSLRSFHLAQVGFAPASRVLCAAPSSARASWHKPGEVYRLPFNLVCCEMRVRVNLRAGRLVVWLELSHVREC